jgi:NAD(P)-dependent dehydrogenase (short-subunit alcohol dehydrogenase family)
MADDPFDFTGRTALVTGSGSDKGIGFAAARLLARLGASVAITSTTAERIEARASELRADGDNVFSYVADLTDRDQAFELVAAAHEALGPVEILVNAAGLVQTGPRRSARRLTSSRPRICSGSSRSRSRRPSTRLRLRCPRWSSGATAESSWSPRSPART